MNKVKKAKMFARKKHFNQKRRDGTTPMIIHLEEVVKRLQIMGIKDETILASGWLHDIIEDTNADYDEIYRVFGKRIADIVSALTKDTRLKQEFKENEYINRLRKSTWQSKIVKLADIIANLSDLKNSNYSRKEKKNHVEMKIKYIKSIQPAITFRMKEVPGLKIIQDELTSILKEYNKKEIKLT